MKKNIMLKAFVKENTWLPKTELISFGWGNGYVVIPKDHPMYGIDYLELDEYVNVHGGLTFSKEVSTLDITSTPELNNEDLGAWMIGFDTCHAGDTLINWSKNRVIEETENLQKQVEMFSGTMPSFS